MAQEIALKLGVSHSTVKNQLASARERIGARTNQRIVAECYEQGWIETREHAQKVEEWPKVTPAQHAYLDAFDRMLLTPFGSEAERRGRLEMRYMLGAMCIERGRSSIPGSQEHESPALAA